MGQRAPIVTAGPVSTQPIRKLRETITANPAAPLRPAVVAPGGYGKSTLLGELSHAYQDAGFEVVTDWPTTGAEDWRKSAMLVDTEGVTEMMWGARATSLLTQDGSLLPLCARATAEVVHAEQYLGVLQRLAELQFDHAEPILPFARFLLGGGATGSTVAAVLDKAAREVAGHDPETAAELFGAAVSAGRPVTAVVADWARAAALAGDLDTALRLADQAISGQEPACRAAAARVAAAALAHRGHGPAAPSCTGGPATDRSAPSRPWPPATRADGPPTLLDCARQLQSRQRSAQPSQQSPQETGSPLSGREREVVQGMTYKQIGDRVLISAKTVEHHMARIRHRLGVAKRGELITQLPALRPGTAQGLGALGGAPKP